MLKTLPSITISLTDKKDSVKEIDIYPMPNSEGSLTRQDSSGTPLKYDVDRMFGYLKPEKEFVIIQHYSFDILFRKFSDFDRNKPKPSVSKN